MDALPRAIELCRSGAGKIVARLNGWQRLWVLTSVLYLIPVVVITFLEFPTVERTEHTDEFYKQLSPDSGSKLALSSSKRGGVDADDVDFEVEMPNGHMLRFRKGVTEDQTKAVALEYYTLVERATTKKRPLVLGYAFLAWIGPCIALYTLGWTIGWVYRGFRPTS